VHKVGGRRSLGCHSLDCCTAFHVSIENRTFDTSVSGCTTSEDSAYFIRGPALRKPRLVRAPAYMALTVESKLNALGFFPRPAWLQACLRHQTEEVQGFAGLPLEEQAQLCLADFLECDMNTAALQRLPPGIFTLHKEELKGRYILQVSVISNYDSFALKTRHSITAITVSWSSLFQSFFRSL
jgi:hypothetical protein